MKTILTFLILTVLAAQSKAQPYPKNYFSTPLDPPLILTGTFGEIRPNHFHSGVDFSTNEDEGKNVYAAAEGYVSRIKISNDGFGKALYITHPNGFVTVYAHLQRFGNEVQRYVTKTQYEQQEYELELLPKPNEFKVKKGDLVGLSGSTGDAAGPHLHFEIRDVATEEPINPLLFGLPVNDTVPPVISLVRIFPKKGLGILNSTDTAITYNIDFDPDISEYSLDMPDPIQLPDPIRVLGNIGFGIEATDHQHNADTDPDGNNSQAALGIYSAQLSIDGFVVFEYKMDRFNFSDTRYANAHVDYFSKMRDGPTIQRCFTLPGNHLKIYSKTTKDGYVNFIDAGMHTVEFVVKDVYGNKAELKFNVTSSADLADKAYQPVPAGASLVTNGKGITINKPNVEIAVPAGTVYDNFQLLVSESPLQENMFAPVYHIGDRFEPIHTSISVSIKPAYFPDPLKLKAAFVSIDPFGNYVYEGGTWADEFLTAKVRHFGDFTIAVDTIPPTIMKEYYPADMNSARGAQVQFTVIDNLSGIKKVHVTVDGKWVLMEYNKKESMISGDVFSFTQNMEHKVEVKVVDEKGNEAKFSDTFYY